MKSTSPIDAMTREFPRFLEALWHETGLTRKAALSAFEFDMAEWAQHGPPLRGINGFRGVGKSTMVTCAYATWRLWTNPEEDRIIIVSKAAGHAKNTVSQIRQWIETVWFLSDLAPDPRRDHRDKEDQFDVGPVVKTKEPSVRGLGIEGQITGTRASLVIADDIETLENSKTAEARAFLRRQKAEFTRVSTFGKKEVMVVGTPWHEDSVYEDMRRTGYTFRTYPGVLPPASGLFARTKVRDWAPIVTTMIEQHEAKNGPIGDEEFIPCVPGRFGLDWLLQERSYGSFEFATQILCISRLGEGFRYLRLNDLVVPEFDFTDGRVPTWIKWGTTHGENSTEWDERDIGRVGIDSDALYKPIMFPDPRKNPEEWSQIIDIRMVVDPAGGGADETAYAVGGFMAGFIWVFACGGMGASTDEHGASEAVQEELCRIARRFRVGRLIVEGDGNLDLYAQAINSKLPEFVIAPGADASLPKGWTCRAESVKVPRGKSKEQRIVGWLSPVMGLHRLIIHRDAIKPTEGLRRDYELQYQLSTITTQPGCLAHEDRADALATLVSQFSELVGGNPAMQADRLREKHLDAVRMRDLERGPFFRGKKPLRWNAPDWN